MANELIQLKDGVDNAYVESVPYSTDEKRIGTWIDGKPIYRKVVQYTNTSMIGALNATTTILVPHGIQNLKQCVNAYAFRGGYCFPNANGGTTPTIFNGIYSITTSNVEFKIINDAWSSGLWTFILEYTKTTD